MRRGDHVTLLVDVDHAYGWHGAPRRVQAGTHGVITGRWPQTGPDLREGWWVLAVEDGSENETVHVPVKPEHVEPTPHCAFCGEVIEGPAPEMAGRGRVHSRCADDALDAWAAEHDEQRGAA